MGRGGGETLGRVCLSRTREKTEEKIRDTTLRVVR